MTKSQTKKRKKDLGIFYTPQEVVSFIFDILKIWKSKQPKRWIRKNPSVIDPAVGEGGFLKVGIDKGFTKPDWIFGIDIDINAVNKWKKVNLLKEFGGNEDDLEAHFFHQNGLEKIKWDQHKSKYYGKLKKEDIKNEQFDCVVGNPPYGGVGLGDTELTDDLIVHLAKFEILPKLVKDNLGIVAEQADLFGSEKSSALNPKAKQSIKSFPIEILFLERFIRLAKPGGWIAIVIPDGILTNSNSHYVREFILKKTKLESIVSLPRETFKNAGTSAKTSILFLRKYKKVEKIKDNYAVFLASLDKMNKDGLDKIAKKYQKYYNLKRKSMKKSDLVQITRDQTGRKTVMVRVDKTLKELMEEKPSSRWSADYWHPKYDKLVQTIRKNKTIILDEHRDEIKSGYRSGGVEFVPSGYPYLQVRNILETGIDLVNVDFISDESPAKQSNKRVNYGDILINRSGEGSVGRVTVFLNEDIDVYVGGHVYRFSVNNISPIYITIFLKTRFGKMQIHRFESGVSGKTEVDLDEILHIEVPILNNQIIKCLEKNYLEMTKYHVLAMQAKKRAAEKEYKENLRTAEKMLQDLIKRTEDMIKGKRKDVI